MSIQIFKHPIPKQLLITLLDAICLKNEKHYTLNNEVFKKGIFTKLADVDKLDFDPRQRTDAVTVGWK